MAHIHELVDFVNAAFIVHPTEPKVLLIAHKKLGGWFAPGGHIELHEDPDAALIREVAEETGLAIGANCFVMQPRVSRQRMVRWLMLDRKKNHDVRMNYQPWAVETHNFVPVKNHRHVALVYLARSKTDQVKLEEAAHNGIRWFSIEDLKNPDFKLLDTIRLYGIEAISFYFPQVEEHSDDQDHSPRPERRDPQPVQQPCHGCV